MATHIVCGVDGSEEALGAARIAASLAQRLDAPLALVHALSIVPASAGLRPIAPSPRVFEREERAVQEAGEQLVAGIAEQVSAPQGVTARMQRGEPVDLVLRTADELDAALIVVGAHGRGRAGRVLLGSVSNRLAASAPCPVVVVPSTAKVSEGLAGPVLCGIDDPENARGAIVAARWLARALDTELAFVHVLAPGRPFGFPAGAGASRPPVTVHHRESAAHALFEALGELADGARVLVEPLNGGEDDTLTQVARREAAPLLVVGSRGRGPVRSAVLGSVSAGLSTQAPCPIVVVSPEARRSVRGPGRTGRKVDAA